MPKINESDQFYILRTKDGWISSGHAQAMPKLYKLGAAKSFMTRLAKRHKWALEHYARYGSSDPRYRKPVMESWEIVRLR